MKIFLKYPNKDFGNMMFVLAVAVLSSLSFAKESTTAKSCKKAKINIPEETRLSALRDGIDYCGMLTEALKGNSGPIFLFSMIQMDAAAKLGHGNVLVHLIQRIGEEKFSLAFKAKSKVFYPVIQSVLDAGLSSFPLEAKIPSELSLAFPKVALALQSGGESASRSRGYLCEALCEYKVKGAHRRIGLISRGTTQSESWRMLNDSCKEIRGISMTQPLDSEAMLYVGEATDDGTHKEYSLRKSSSDRDCVLVLR